MSVPHKASEFMRCALQRGADMGREPFLEVRDITKRFYGVKVLDDVSVSVYKGEVLGVIGENGAGKSTLMKIVAGSYSFEEGQAFIEGKSVVINSPFQMREYGINMVYQDTKLVPEIKVFQNVYLNNEITDKLGFTNDKVMRKNCHELLQRFGIDIDTDAYIKDLTIAQMQLVEIAKALLFDAKLLILDEPTSSLTPREVNRLFDIVNEIKSHGTAIVFISHRISELLQICDRFVVLRDGKKVGEVPSAEANEDNLAQIMVGRDIFSNFEKLSDPKAGEVIFSVKGLSNGIDYEDVSFNLHSGEILGFYGIEGNGQREVLRTIFGLMDDCDGTIELAGKEVDTRKPSRVFKSGISYVTNDRHGENVFMPLPIRRNILAPNLFSWSRFGVVKQGHTKEKVLEGIEKFGVKCYGPDQLLRELSGGNQQKVAIAAKYLQNPKIMIFDECTKGVDVGAKGEIYTFLKELAAQGVGVIMLSSDMTEILSISDRILVMAEGRIRDDILSAEATEERIISSAIIIDSQAAEETGEAHPEAEETDAPQKEGGSSIRGLDFASLLIGSKWGPPLLLSVLIIIMMAIGGVFSKTFLVPYNMGLIMWQAAPLLLVVLGQALVIMTGHMDLSVGPLMSLITCVMSLSMTTNESIVTGIAIALAVGVAAGLLNGLLVVIMNLPHFVATLSTQIIFFGAALLLRETAGGSIAPAFVKAVKFKIGGTWPVVFFIIILLVVLFEIILQKTKLGVAVYAIGSNREAAFSSGIKVSKMRIMVFVFSGVMAALAGMVLACRIGCGDPSSGANFSFQSITSVLLGGIVLSGGRGNITGATMGAALITILMNFLNMMKVNSYWQYVCMGIIILVSLIMYYYADVVKKNKYKNRLKNKAMERV